MTTVGDLGERKLIERIMRQLTPMPGMPVGFGDDVSATSLGDGLASILKTDMLVWNTDAPQGMTPFQAARKTVVMNFSDLGSKGVRPIAFLASLALPRNLRVDKVEEMARGFNAGAREYGAYVLGGDTNEAGEVIISGMAYGVAEESKLLKRDGAQPGDILATTGGFGNTAAAFKILLQGYSAPGKIRDPLLDSVYMPKARVDEGVALSETRAVSACMDSSDGLGISLYDLSKCSGVGFRLEELPASDEATAFAELHDLDLTELVLYGGEEYELVFTVTPNRFDEVKAALKRTGFSLLKIGQATQDRRIVFIEEGEEKSIVARGWDHFKN